MVFIWSFSYHAPSNRTASRRRCKILDLRQALSYFLYDIFVALIHIVLIFLRAEFQRIPQILDIAHLLQTFNEQRIGLIVLILRTVALPPVVQLIEICRNYGSRTVNPAPELLIFAWFGLYRYCPVPVEKPQPKVIAYFLCRVDLLQSIYFCNKSRGVSGLPTSEAVIILFIDLPTSYSRVKAHIPLRNFVRFFVYPHCNHNM